MRKRQIKKAIRLIRIAVYKKSIWKRGCNSMMVSALLQDHWLRFEGGIKPADTPF